MRKNAKRLLSAILALSLLMAFTISGVPYAKAESDHTETSDNGLIGDERNENEFPLSIGEITSIESADASFTISLNENAPVVSAEEVDLSEEKEEDEGGVLSAIGGLFSSLADFIFPTTTAKAASDKLKVTYSGYVSYCKHRMGYKYVSEDGKYKDRLVYCLDIGKNSTDGTIEAGKNVSAKITYCLVNGAQKKGGKCKNSKYSSDSANADYFITSAAIHVVNGEVKLSYYNDGSGVYKNIEQLVNDAKKVKSSEYNLSTGRTKDITYKITPSVSEWIDMGDGLYRSKDKFVRTKEGPIIDVSYSITGAPSGLTTGEINKSSSDISDADDLKKYDICVAQTNKDSASANFYLYAKQEAYDQIIAQQKTIKVKANVRANEKGGRSWKPTIVSQQRITLLEEFENPKSTSASVKVPPSKPEKGSILIKKVAKGDNKPINGATYYLYEDPECEDLFCELHPDGTGNGVYASDIEDITQDTYYLKEIINPDGYILDEKVYTVDKSYFTLYDASGTMIQEGREYTHEEEEEPVNIMITKKDSDSGVTVTNAGFAIFDDAACTKRTLYDPASPSKGEVPILTYSEDLDGYVSEKFIKTQDTYYVKEVNVPEGYQDTGKVYTVNVDRGELSTIEDVLNTAIKCEVSAVKLDAETRDPQGDATLVGATYGLYAAEDINHPDGSGYMKGTEITATSGTDFTPNDTDARANALLATIKTDPEGKFGFKDLYYGNYYIKELEPSEGYLLSETRYDLNFKSKGNTSAEIKLDQEVTETVKKQAFEIIKVSTSGESTEIPLVKGAEFTVKLASEIAKVGWDTAKTYDVITTDEKGFARSIELPYGTYTVKETKTPKDLYKTKDFTVKVTEDSRTPQVWRTFNDAPFEAYIRLIKKDTETGQIVLLSGVTFKIKKAGEDGYISQKVGDKHIEEFITDETGTVTTPLKLLHGDYELTEIKAPYGYLVKETSVPFTVTQEGAVQVREDADGDPVIDVELENTSVKGKVIIHKIGEILTGITYDTIFDRILTGITGDNRSVTFTYGDAPLSGAEFVLIADEDVYTPDHQKKDGVRTIATYDGKSVKKDEIIARGTTDANGDVIFDRLPLGKYHVEEVTAPKGFVKSDEKYPFDLKYIDDHTAVIEAKTDVKDERQKLELTVVKSESAVTGSAVDLEATSGSAVSTETSGVSASPSATASLTPTPTASSTASPTATPDATSSPTPSAPEVVTGSAITLNPDTAGTPVAGATYGVFATTDILDKEGNVLVAAGTLIEQEKTDENGKILFTADLPLGKYYIKEIEPAPGYLNDENEYTVDFTNPEVDVKLTKKELRVNDIPIITRLSKTDITSSSEIANATLQILDHNDEVFAEWTTDGKPYYVSAIPAGDYTLKEISAPYGYKIATEVAFSVKESAEIEKVTMVDDRVMGILMINKTDRTTGDPIEDVTFEVYDPDGQVVDTLITDKDGKATSKPLPIGTYKENGEFDKPFTYTVKETKPASGYVPNDATYSVEFKYEDSATEDIVHTLQVTNVPTEPKLPQTGGDGTHWIYLSALLVGAGTGVFLYRRKKNKKIGG